LIQTSDAKKCAYIEMILKKYLQQKLSTCNQNQIPTLLIALQKPKKNIKKTKKKKKKTTPIPASVDSPCRQTNLIYAYCQKKYSDSGAWGQTSKIQTRCQCR
jgi:hypothetical protein